MLVYLGFYAQAPRPAPRFKPVSDGPRWLEGGDSASFVVPEGHAVHAFSGSTHPNLNQVPGGVWFLTTGVRGDDQVAEIAALFDAAEASVLRSPRQVYLAAITGQLSDLCAPSDPSVHQLAAAVVWFFHAGSLDGWLAEPARRQELARGFQRIRSVRGNHALTTQWAFVERGSREASVLIPLLHELGVEARYPEADGSLFVVVQRPEGVALTALLGSNCNAEQRAFASQPLISTGVDEPSEVLVRAPRLHRLVVQAAEDSGSTAWRALCAELLRREAPLLFTLLPKPNGEVAVPTASWPGLGNALPVFPDLRAIRQTARDQGRPEGSYGVGSLAPGRLFAWVLEQGFSIALNGFLDVNTPVYIGFRPSDLHALIAGRIPARSQSS